MRWHSRYHDTDRWKPWFAWHPVYLADLDAWVWLEWVGRRTEAGWDGISWVYKSTTSL